MWAAPLLPLNRTNSDSRIPGITSFRRCGTETLPKAFERVGDRQTGYVFHAFVAKLAGDTQPERAAEGDRKISVVHCPSQQSLGVLSIGHVDALPPVTFDRKVHEIARLWQEP